MPKDSHFGFGRRGIGKVGRWVHITINAEPQEIAALVLALQERRNVETFNSRDLSEAIRGTLLEFAGKSQKYQ